MNNIECNHPLTAISAKYKASTDKCPMSDYHIKHVYTEIYGPLFNHLREEPIKMLEIGVRWGGSLVMWREFFTKAQIYGIDIDLTQVKEELNGIKIIEGDAYDQNFAENQFKDIKFDIMIDDGNHDESSLIKYFNIYRHFLKRGGYLIAEDIKPELVKSVIDNFDGPINNMSVIDRTHCVPSTRGERLIMYKDY